MHHYMSTDCSGMKRSQSTSDLHHTFPIPRPLKSPQQSLTMRHSEVDSGYYTEITSTGTSHSGWSGGPTYWKTSHGIIIIGASVHEGGPTMGGEWVCCRSISLLYIGPQRTAHACTKLKHACDSAHPIVLSIP